MQPRSRRVLVYSLALLFGPLPLIPYAPGTREFRLALIAACVIWIAAGVYVIRGERAAYWRPMFAQKMLAAAYVTSFAAIAILLLNLYWLFRLAP